MSTNRLEKLKSRMADIKESLAKIEQQEADKAKPASNSEGSSSSGNPK